MRNNNKLKKQGIDSLSKEEKELLLKKYRRRIDFFDRILVYLLNQRTKAAVMIGRIKISLNQPTYNPDRERDVLKKVNRHNHGPLTHDSLDRIYERILDESRATQKAESHKLLNNKSENREKKKPIGDFFTKRDKIIIISFFIIVLSLLIYSFFSPNHYKGPTPVTFEIKRGETLNNTIDSLYNRGIIPNKRNMRIAAFLLGGDRNIKAGRYRIPNDLSYVGLLELFMSGKREVPALLDFFPGINIYQIAGQLQQKIHADSLQVLRLCRDKNFLKSLGVNAPSLEGYLIPDTYYFYDKTSPEEVLTKVKYEFNKFLTDSLKLRLRKLGYDLTEVLTVASIVEGESAKPEEYPLIAGVYYNRLKRGMKLQADPTVQYALMGKWRRLFNRDLNINSPYNTYLHYGLPPGPINNPGRSAILAALFPAKHNYIYFVADGSGGHKFATNYEDHLKLVKQYRAWLKNQITE
ncbi:MAG: endolytic transglycosylase MltG [Bacillota bacterium]